jgi:hypothetical protein
MTFDLTGDLVAALGSPSGRAALREALAPVIADEVKRAISEQHQKLQPLADILHLSLDAARKREARDPGLRKLAIASGRRRLYLAHQVHTYLQAGR